LITRSKANFAPPVENQLRNCLWKIEAHSVSKFDLITRATSSTSGRAKNQIPISSATSALPSDSNPAGMAAILRRSGARVKSKAKF
jgi:hypothetical protein